MSNDFDRFKFRVRDIKNNKWVRGAFSSPEEIAVSDNVALVRNYSPNNGGYTLKNIETIILDNNYVVNQSTGIRDKRGNLIFEGDIVSYMAYNALYEVVWNPYESKFELNKNTYNFCFSDFEQDDITIVGNIYEKPNLKTFP